MDTRLTVYRSLQKRIDDLPVPFPATQAGVELRLLRHLFSPEEAVVACELSAVGESVSKIQRRIQKKGLSYTKRSLTKLLNELLKKGAIIGGIVKTKRGVERKYSLMPLAIGMFEMQVDKLSAEYTRDFEEYLRGGFSEAFFNNRTGQMRTIPVGSAVTSDNAVGAYDDVREYVLTSPGPFGVMNCVCRQGKDLLDKSCSHSDIRETCLMIGNAAVTMHQRGNARLVERGEFLDLLQRAEERSFVLQAKNTKEPEYICCCCGDCCEILTTAKKLPRPVEAFHTNYFARVDSGLCNGCGRCVIRCQMDAVSLTGPAAECNGSATAVVDLDRCIGCGLCVPTCPTGGVSLVRTAKITVPPRNSLSMYGRMYLERKGLFGAMAVGLKYLFGRRI